MKYLWLVQDSLSGGSTDAAADLHTGNCVRDRRKTSAFAADPVRRGKVLSADFADFRRLWGGNKALQHDAAEGGGAALSIPVLTFLYPNRLPSHFEIWWMG